MSSTVVDEEIGRLCSAEIFLLAIYIYLYSSVFAPVMRLPAGKERFDLWCRSAGYWSLSSAIATGLVVAWTGGDQLRQSVAISAALIIMAILFVIEGVVQIVLACCLALRGAVAKEND